MSTDQEQNKNKHSYQAQELPQEQQEQLEKSGLKVCEDCFELIAEDASFCGECGSKIGGEPRKCHKCGAESTGEFCGICGAPMAPYVCSLCSMEHFSDFCPECGTPASNLALQSIELLKEELPEVEELNDEEVKEVMAMVYDLLPDYEERERMLKDRAIHLREKEYAQSRDKRIHETFIEVNDTTPQPLSEQALEFIRQSVEKMSSDKIDLKRQKEIEKQIKSVSMTDTIERKQSMAEMRWTTLLEDLDGIWYFYEDDSREGGFQEQIMKIEVLSSGSLRVETCYTYTKGKKIEHLTGTLVGNNLTLKSLKVREILLDRSKYSYWCSHGYVGEIQSDRKTLKTITTAFPRKNSEQKPWSWERIFVKIKEGDYGKPTA